MSIQAVIISVLASVLGTGLGGGLGSFMRGQDRRTGSFLLEFAAGLMLAVVCFDMLPACTDALPLPMMLFGLGLGMTIMMASDLWMRRQAHPSGTSLTQTGLSMAFGVALHNFPEGLAIGSGFGVSTALGVKLAMAVVLHDIPEGMSVAIPLRMGKVGRGRVFLLTALSGLPVALGALLGLWVGRVSETLISLCLALASGAMIYIVLVSMIPESKRMYGGRLGAWGAVLGLLTGLILNSVLH